MSESNADVMTAENSFIPDDGFAPQGSFERFKRMSRSQFGLMVDFMTLNPELVGHRSVSKEVWEKKWEELTALLNADWTGANRQPKRWRKVWADQKNLIKLRAARQNECKNITGNNDFYKLSEMDERVLKLMKSASDKKKNIQKSAMQVKNHNLVNTYNLNGQNLQNVSHQIISPSGYIVFGVQAENIPMTVQPVYQSSSKRETTNVLIGLESSNTVLTELQLSSNKPVSVEETTMLSSSVSASQLNTSQDMSDIKESLKSVADSSEMQTQEESGEKDTSSLIVKLQPYEVSKSHTNSSISEDGQRSNNQEKTDKNVTKSSVTNSSIPVKRRKLHHQPLLHRRNEIAVAKLLQRQNELLEGIAGTLTRIEKSVTERLSLEDQRKNHMLINISENIERLSQSLGTVSKSLKTIADN